MDDILKLAGVMFAVVGIPTLIGLIALPIGKALGIRIKGSSVDPGEVAELRAEVEELRAIASRVPELEERLDFAERLLSQGQSERPGLPRAPIEGVHT